MVNIAQRIQELRDERGMSRYELSAALGFPKNLAEKFETGRQTPTQEQQDRIADFFGVSVFYLRGESNDRLRQEDWMNGDFEDDDPPPPPRIMSTKLHPKESPAPKSGDGSLVEPFLRNKAFQEMVRATVLDVLRSKEGQELLAKAVRSELLKR